MKIYIIILLLIITFIVLYRKLKEEIIRRNKEEIINKIEEYWNRFIMDIKPPPPELTTWGNDTKLSLVIVEPRKHKLLRGVLNNIANIYGSSNVQLYIFHGNENKEFVQDIINNWKNVKLINLGVSNLNIKEYSLLLTDPNFWKTINSEFALIFQTDTFTRKRIPNYFFNYDYIGAPWNNRPYGDILVGNGGYSLRKVSKMIEICQKYKYTGEPEDIYFCKYLDNIPKSDIASLFAVESIYHPDTCGIHKPWDHLTLEEIKNLLS